ncbi:hypothetical protein I553_2190 [Mycobacterium xenopi 4042]|uniref:Uncharacterized protein n=1 Tax=Mycobacterium xenopi 4042 TaxID=1299334 RepID=X8DK25_MYCXE|nr:hypothetical protein I553_2190 [Mycobacterium xenopi 4042]
MNWQRQSRASRTEISVGGVRGVAKPDRSPEFCKALIQLRRSKFITSQLYQQIISSGQ